MKVLVCGGRDYHNADEMERVLRATLSPGDIVIHGAARGADALAGDVAGRVLGHALEVYPADWNAHGKAAGPIRNQKMLVEGQPDLVLAFAGGRGTADMIRRSRKAGVEVREF